MPRAISSYGSCGEAPRTVLRISTTGFFSPFTVFCSLSRDGRAFPEAGRWRRFALDRETGPAASRRGLRDLALFDEPLVFRPALQELQRALFLHDLRGAAGEVAAAAPRLPEARALHAPAEFPDGRKRALASALLHFRIDAHSRHSTTKRRGQATARSRLRFRYPGNSGSVIASWEFVATSRTSMVPSTASLCPMMRT